MTATTSTAVPSSSASPADLSAAAMRLYTGGPIFRRKLQHLRPYICPFERLLPHIPSRSSVFDIGCGGGLFLALLADSGRLDGGGRGLGLDISAAAVETARQMVSEVPRFAGVLEFQAVERMDDWPAGPFDVVSMIDVMHHIPPAAQPQAFELAAARIAPGGMLLYKDMHASAGIRTLANRLHDLVLARQWIHYVPIDKVETWGAAARLELTHNEDMNRLWYAHQLRVFRRPV